MEEQEISQIKAFFQIPVSEITPEQLEIIQNFIDRPQCELAPELKNFYCRCVLYIGKYKQTKCMEHHFPFAC
jgi:hypothetical protein